MLTGNNEYVAFPPGYPKFDTRGLVKSFTFRIPRFNNTVLIDPSVNVGTYTPAGVNPTVGTKTNPGGGGGGRDHNGAQSLHFVSSLLLFSMLVSLYCFS